MFRYPMCLLALVLGLLFSPTAEGGIFRKTKTNPAERVPELIKILQSDPDERKRAEAADELQEYDTKTYPDIQSALISALQKDTSSSVRSEAAQSLSKLRPVNQQAGFALETALASDASIRVRMAARTALWTYTLLGYRSGKQEETNQDQTGEPPLAPNQPNAPQPRVGPTATNPQTRLIPLPTSPRGQATPTSRPNPSVRSQTGEPPLAQPLPTPTPPSMSVPMSQPAPLFQTQSNSLPQVQPIIIPVAPAVVPSFTPFLPGGATPVEDGVGPSLNVPLK